LAAHDSLLGHFGHMSISMQSGQMLQFMRLSIKPSM